MEVLKKHVELVHLTFLRFLGDKVDKQLFALKGGCNLRFYFKSIRYSEDIDLDVTTIAKGTLENQVTKILESNSFTQVLGTHRIEIRDVRAVKQTETTQRWKLSVVGPGSSSPLPTKIEFSRRPSFGSTAYEEIDPDVISHHRLYRFFCNHYDRSSAFTQKIGALIGRTSPQARDVFDLDLLMQGLRSLPQLPTDLHSDLEKAIETAMSVSFEDYKGQVVAYLADEYQADFGSKDSWNTLQERAKAL